MNEKEEMVTMHDWRLVDAQKSVLIFVQADFIQLFTYCALRAKTDTDTTRAHSVDAIAKSFVDLTRSLQIFTCQEWE